MSNNNYVGAPYNFVSFAQNIFLRYNSYSDLPAHNKIEKELNCGEITYKILSETPVFISNGKKKKEEGLDFYKNPKGNYAIPGSTMRGLVRNNMKILGLGAVGSDIEDRSIMYRKIIKKKDESVDNHIDRLNNKYTRILGVKQLTTRVGSKVKRTSVAVNVKAGYISCEQGKYMIYKNILDERNVRDATLNYHLLKETYVVDTVKDSGSNEKFAPIIKNVGIEDGCKLHNKDYSEKSEGKKGRIGVENNSYEPFYMEVSYDLKDGKNVVALSNDLNRYKRKGYLLGAGKMQNTKVLYVIPEIIKDKSKATQISENDIASFKKDFETKQNQLGINKEHFNLPEEGKVKPVFYIEYQGRLYFGFSPYLRIFYDHSIKDGISQQQREYENKMIGLDYADAVFGFTKEECDYKSRVYFEDAEIYLDNIKLNERNPQKIILAEPKPSSYHDYIKQNDKEKNTYDSEKFEIRGFKQYWLKDVSVEDALRDNDKVATEINPLPVGTAFLGKIKFRNLTNDELGLLLWSLTLNKECRQNIGMGKPYGFGRIKLSINELEILDFEKLYSTKEALFFENAKIEKNKIYEYIAEFKSYINRKYENSLNRNEKFNIDDQDHIKEFMNIKSNIVNSENVRYMSIDKREYQSRIKSLPTINQFLKSTKR